MIAHPFTGRCLLVTAMLMASATAFADTAQPVKAPTIAKELQQIGRASCRERVS